MRLACDDATISEELANQLIAIARNEPDIEVRSQLACSARRLPASQGLPIIRELLQRREDNDDIFQPLLLWWAIEENCGRDPVAVLELFTSGELWDEPIVKTHITQRLMRRFAATGRGTIWRCARG